MRTLLVIAAVITCGATFAATAADDAAAHALATKSGCLKCHSIDKKKDGPSFKEVAAKYKGKPDAEQKLFTHLTTNPKVKIDGKEEAHDNLKTKNDAEVKNVVAWVLSR
jgi:cytochrome c